MTTAEPDELYTLRNLFWIGAFQEAINEASSSSRLSSYSLDRWLRQVVSH